MKSVVSLLSNENEVKKIMKKFINQFLKFPFIDVDSLSPVEPRDVQNVRVEINYALKSWQNEISFVLQLKILINRRENSA